MQLRHCRRPRTTADEEQALFQGQFVQPGASLDVVRSNLPPWLFDNDVAISDHCLAWMSYFRSTRVVDTD